MKQSALPDTSKLPKQPVNRELDAVSQAIKWFDENGVDKLSWRDFQQKLQQISQKFPKLFTEIRKNRSHITKGDLQQWLQQAERSNQYGMSYEKYHDPKHSFRDVEQLVMQLNEGADASKVIKADSALAQYLGWVGQSSRASGHPAGPGTVGWLRVDFVNDDWLFVDEIQSDLVNSIQQAQAFVSNPSYDEWFAAQSPAVQEKINEIEGARQRFSGAKSMLLAQGYTSEKLEEMKAKLVELFQDWSEYAIATVLEIARDHGITNVAINSSESIAQRDNSVDASKVKMYYDNLAKSFGFKKETVELPEISGKFWVRKASLNRYLA
jgi:hypothetical protein